MNNENNRIFPEVRAFLASLGVFGEVSVGNLEKDVRENGDEFFCRKIIVDE